MAVHDRRYKRILTSPVFAYDVARLLADEFNLGTVARPPCGPAPPVRSGSPSANASPTPPGPSTPSASAPS